MYEIGFTDIFDQWLDKLKDGVARAKITARIDRLRGGNFGDVKPVGEGISELRIHYGPGYRIYFTRRGKKIVLVLYGGSKKTQIKDIKLAKKLAQQIKA
jgi:putative addiction module killer protein